MKGGLVYELLPGGAVPTRNSYQVSASATGGGSAAVRSATAGLCTAADALLPSYEKEILVETLAVS